MLCRSCSAIAFPSITTAVTKAPSTRGRDQSCHRWAASRLRAAQPFGELPLVDRLDAELIRSRGLRARVLAHDYEVRLLRHARGHSRAGRLGRRRGLVPRQALEAAGEDDRLAGEWLLPPGLPRRLVLHPDAGRPQLLDQLSVRRVGEPGVDAVGDLGPDLLDVVDVLLGRL